MPGWQPTRIPAFRIGYANQNWSRWNGRIDDVQIYDFRLSDDQILTVMDGGVISDVVIPEPSTFLIWALGLLGLGWYGRRRKGMVEIAAVPARQGWTEENRVAIRQMLERNLTS